MVLTQAENEAFFTDATSMALPAATYAQMATEGITTVYDLEELDEETLKLIASNLRAPRYIPDPADNAAPNATICTAGSDISAKSQKRLYSAIKLIQYYETTDRPITVANIIWLTVIKTFIQHHDILEARYKADQPEVPLISKDLPILMWIEAYKDWARTAMGCRKIPLAYVIRPEAAVPASFLQLLATDMPFSAVHGSVELELIARASHTHGAFAEDNAMVYDSLEKATRGTEYASSLKPFQKTKDGRRALEALATQYTGKDKWKLILADQQQFLHNRKWKATGQYTLDKFCSAHREAHQKLINVLATFPTSSRTSTPR